MESLRSLAISLEEEDRGDLGGYIAVVLQKLANMNELFLGERVRASELRRYTRQYSSRSTTLLNPPLHTPRVFACMIASR